MHELVIYLNQIMADRHADPAQVSVDEIKIFCQNASLLELTRMRSVE
jgi:hypothetical protein